MSPDEEYEMLLSSASQKKTRQEPAKEAALQRTVNLKLRQATQELLNKRNALAEKLCRQDDRFGDKEKSYKAQMHAFTQQIKKEQASRVRAESQAETYKTAAETQTANVQVVAAERDAFAVRLQQAQEVLRLPCPVSCTCIAVYTHTHTHTHTQSHTHIYLSIYTPICLSIHLSYLFIYPSIHPSLPSLLRCITLCHTGASRAGLDGKAYVTSSYTYVISSYVSRYHHMCHAGASRAGLDGKGHASRACGAGRLCE